MRRRRTQPIMYMPRGAKVNEAQPKTAEQIFAEKDAEIAALEAELAELKEKTRWRKQSEEPAPKDIELLVCGRGRKGQAYFLVTETDGDYWYDNIGDSVSLDVDYWRPLDLPEMGEAK